MTGPTDPRTVGGNIAGPGDPNDRNGVVIDTSRAVLLDESECALLETGGQGTALALLLRGRINLTNDRASVLFLMGGDGVAALVSELIALGHRVGPEFGEALMVRVHDLIAKGAVGPGPWEKDQ